MTPGERRTARRAIDASYREAVECLQCGYEFDAPESISGENTYHYCSGACALLAYAARVRALGVPAIVRADDVEE